MKLAPSSLLNAKIPTIIGLILLLVGLVSAVFFLRIGPGFFTPRAAPQTTPKNVKITNLTDSTVTVSFITDEATAGFVKYGTSATSLGSREGDDRDQLAGNVGTFTTHHITLRNLQPNTTYFFVLGTGTASEFDNSGKPYSVKTAAKTNQTISQTVYGTVLKKDTSPAEGSIVYLTIDKGSELSTLVRSSGTWAIPLSQLRSPDGGTPPAVNTNTLMQVFAQGIVAADTSTLTTTVGQPQFPVKTITLGQNEQAQATVAPTATTAPATTGSAARPTATATVASANTNQKPAVTASSSATPTKAAVGGPVTSPTATATKKPTSTPKPPTATPQEVSLPATNTPQPVTGVTENTLAVMIAGILFVTFGVGLYINFKR